MIKSTYNIKEAQANLPKLCRSGKRFIIANRDNPVAVALPIEDFEALMETMDVLADPVAMQALEAARKGETAFVPLDLNDENFGL